MRKIIESWELKIDGRPIAEFTSLVDAKEIVGHWAKSDSELYEGSDADLVNTITGETWGWWNEEWNLENAKEGE